MSERVCTRCGSAEGTVATCAWSKNLPMPCVYPRERTTERTDNPSTPADLTDEQLGEIDREACSMSDLRLCDDCPKIRALVAEVRRSRAELAALRDVVKAARIAAENHDPALCLECDERASGQLCYDHQLLRDTVAALDRVDGGGS